MYLSSFQLSPVKKEQVFRPQSYQSLTTASKQWAKGPSIAPQGKQHDLYATPTAHPRNLAELAAPMSPPCVPPLPPRGIIRGQAILLPDCSSGALCDGASPR